MSRIFIEPRNEPLATFQLGSDGVMRLLSKREGMENANVLREGSGVTIYGPPPTLAIAVADASKNEGNSGTTNFTFTVTRSGDLFRPTTVDWAVTGSGGDPANATDFGGTLPSGTVTFAAADASETITVGVSGDTTVESYEAFTVTLSGATNGTITTATAGGLILNDDQSFTVLATDGWQVTDSTPSDLSLAEVPIARQGYTTAGEATTYYDVLAMTKRVRQAYPNQASFTTDQVALSDFIYSTDTAGGATNNSTRTSPKPTAAWVMVDRLLVASSVHWEIVAFHRNARDNSQVACVQVRANDGTTQTAWQTVSTTAISTTVEDINPVEVFAGDIDISALATGSFWLEAKVVPWIGAAASILSSEDQSAVREFSRRWFRKGSTVNYVYVASTGNDTTGVCSTTAATALASPCLTLGGALLIARTALGTGTVGALDGLRVRILDTINAGNPNSAYFPLQQDIAGVIVERAPGVARAAAIVTLNTNFRPGFSNHTSPVTEGSLIFNDVSLLWGGMYSPTGETASKLHVQYWNCSIDYASYTITTQRNNSHVSFFGVVATNPTSSLFAYHSSGQIRMMRGLTVDLNGANMEGWANIGCAITRCGQFVYEDLTKPCIHYNNTFPNPQASVLIDRGGAVAMSGLNHGSDVIVQNLIEKSNTTNSVSFILSADSDYGNITDAIVMHNTFTGAGAYGRANIFYDEHASVARTHGMVAFKGNILPQLNIKGDDYSTILNGARIGHFVAEHGVGFEGNFVTHIDSGGGIPSFSQAYPGLTSTIGGGDPLFTDNQSTTVVSGSPVAGAGGGDYTLQGGSPCIGLLSEPVLKYDLAGAARGTGAQDAGCYA